jgi:uncharacterized membrane protein SpoIIM required for sporulation
MAQSIQNFLQSRKPRWERLETVIKSLEQGQVKALTAADLLDVGRLYREAAADLARLQSMRSRDLPPSEMEVYLNHLVARGYGQVYRTPPPRLASFWRYLHLTLPLTFRETAPWTLFAVLTFLLGFLYGLGASLLDSAFVPLVVPSHLVKQVEEGNVWFDSILAVRPLASSMIMTNNISVSFLAFAFGMTFGLGTLYLMVFNGLLLGAVAGLCHTHNLGIPFWSFVLPHGVIELTAIFMAGGSGFLLATALLSPGDLPRKQALVGRARQAGRLVLGCVPLLVVAGIVEGFFSPALLPASVKFSVAGILFALLLGYLLIPAQSSRDGSIKSSRQG